LISDGARGAWKKINRSAANIDDIVVGLFSGNDSIADVLYATSGWWQISKGGASKWEVITSRGYSLDNMGFGDFNGDGVTDGFISSDGSWKVSWGMRSNWEVINYYGTESISELKFADIDGDKKTDIIKIQ
jgi:hypothetical protein